MCARPFSRFQFQLCFRSLFHSGRSFAFPCNPQGHVEMDQLSEAARNNYLFARAMVGRELATPLVERIAVHRAVVFTTDFFWIGD